MSPEVYGLWFPKFSLLEDSGKTLTLVCDDPMAALWVENSYTPVSYTHLDVYKRQP